MLAFLRASKDLIGQEKSHRTDLMKTILLCLALTLSLAACGVRGDPEAPKFDQQTQ